jgi:hypothetical protein
MDLINTATVIDGAPFTWEERSTYYLSSFSQDEPGWMKLRYGRNTSGTISQICKYINDDSKESEKLELAQIVCGTSEKALRPSSETLKWDGVVYEKSFRQKLSTRFNVPIQEVGLAVWKRDPRFGCSIDGLMKIKVDGEKEETVGIELKLPKEIYRSLIEHLEALKKGFKFPPSYHRHIFTSHYFQMISSAVIMGMQNFVYAVGCTTSSDVYVETIPTNQDLWDRVLYPSGCRFYDRYVAPEMRRHGLQRYDPPTLHMGEID